MSKRVRNWKFNVGDKVSHYKKVKISISQINKNDWFNRHQIQLPINEKEIEIIYPDVNGETIIKVNWKPYNGEFQKTINDGLPGIGYLGTAYTIEQKIQIGFHAWTQNDSEFIYWRDVN